MYEQRVTMNGLLQSLRFILPHQLSIPFITLSGPPQLLLRGPALDLSWDTGHEGMVWDLHPLWDEASCANDAVAADLRVMKDGGIYTHEDMVSDLSAIQDGTMTDDHVIANKDLTHGRGRCS